MVKECSVVFGLCCLIWCLILVCISCEVDVSEGETVKLTNGHSIRDLEEDYFLFYNSTIVIDEGRVNSYWNSFKNLEASQNLSTRYRRGETVRLTFDLPFYGQLVRNVTVATGGFLYTGDYIHPWLAATQYVAPLMANFDPSMSNNSFVGYHDNGTSFTVLWKDVPFSDKKESEPFSFSVTLHDSGVIVFTYYSLPMPIQEMREYNSYVKVGLSDAYIIDKKINFSRRKTIYEYHRVRYSSDDISNGTIITLTPNPTCHGLTDCEHCANFNSVFKCYWCPTINRCSTGTDRKREEWLNEGCERNNIIDAASCPAIGSQGNMYGSGVHDIIL